MELTRRDAITALVTGGVAGLGATAVSPSFLAGSQTAESNELAYSERRQLVAVAEVVFPTEISVTTEYIEEYVSGLPAERRQSLRSTLSQLETYVNGRYGASFSALAVSERDSALRSIGVDRVGSSPDGTLGERVRYHIVNGLLYDLYTTPQGTGLIGIENPLGYPGGYESYQQPPSNE